MVYKTFCDAAEYLGVIQICDDSAQCEIDHPEHKEWSKQQQRLKHFQCNMPNPQCKEKIIGWPSTNAYSTVWKHFNKTSQEKKSKALVGWKQDHINKMAPVIVDACDEVLLQTVKKYAKTFKYKDDRPDDWNEAEEIIMAQSWFEVKQNNDDDDDDDDDDDEDYNDDDDDDDDDDMKSSKKKTAQKQVGIMDIDDNDDDIDDNDKKNDDNNIRIPYNENNEYDEQFHALDQTNGM